MAFVGTAGVMEIGPEATIECAIEAESTFPVATASMKPASESSAIIARRRQTASIHGHATDSGDGSDRSFAGNALR